MFVFDWEVCGDPFDILSVLNVIHLSLVVGVGYDVLFVFYELCSLRRAGPVLRCFPSGFFFGFSCCVVFGLGIILFEMGGFYCTM